MRKLLSFGAVGLVSSAIYFCCTVFFIEIVSIAPTISSAMAFVASFLFSFFANHYFVFRSKEDISKTVVRFALVSAFGFVLTTAIMFAIVAIFQKPYLYGVAVVLVAIPLSNYSLNLHWTFKNSLNR